ncbi:uncharacterized protein LOC133916883 [Phragmites australis]|uniref:uncharacterized protein LOC133916883 n=1 Tax=Phragmites australis TaxID=29695 RepID=UPI002D796430|nr:uncharacterized protein LOC133916883 [Phragmites australis]
MAIAAARRRLWRGMGTAAAAAVSGTDVALLHRLVPEPECRVKAHMEEASSSAPHRDGASWEPLAAALLRVSSPAKAHLKEVSVLPMVRTQNATCEAAMHIASIFSLAIAPIIM